VCVTRPGLLRLHFVPVLCGVVVVAVEAGPLVCNDVVHPERVGHSRFVALVTLLFVFIKALKKAINSLIEGNGNQLFSKSGNFIVVFLQKMYLNPRSDHFTTEN
jgi:hypothetical protein